jgi:rod shape-determining protein MreD
VKRLAFAILMLASVLAQVTWAPRVAVAGVFPNLALVAVIAIAWGFGVRPGMAWACVAGLMLDLTAPGPLGPHALALLAGAYVTGFWARNLSRHSPLHPVLAAAVSTVLYSLVLIGSDAATGLPTPPLGVAVQLIATASLYNAALMPFAVIAISRVHSPLARAPEPA